MSYHLFIDPVSRLKGRSGGNRINAHSGPTMWTKHWGIWSQRSSLVSRKEKALTVFLPLFKEKCHRLSFLNNSKWGKNCKSQSSVGGKTVSSQLHKSRSQEKLNIISLAPHRCAHWQIIWSRSGYLHLSQQRTSEKTTWWNCRVCLPQSHSLQNIWAGKSQDRSKLRLC